MMMSGAILNRELLSLYLYLYLSLSLSLRFNGHFPGESGLAGVYWRKGWWRWWWQLDYWRYMSCKAPVESSPSTNQHPAFLQAGCPSCRPTKSVKALKGKISHSMDLLTPRPPVGLPTLSLTTNSSWLPWGKCHASHQPSDASTPTPMMLLFLEYLWFKNPANRAVLRAPQHPHLRGWTQCLHRIAN